MSVMSHSGNRKDDEKLGSKLKRICRNHKWMLLLNAFLHTIIFLRCFKRTSLSVYIVDVFCLNAWFPTGNIYFSLNGVSWYVSTAIFNWTMYALLKNRIRSIRKPEMNAVILFVCLYIISLVGENVFEYDYNSSINMGQWVMYINPGYNFVVFLMGCILGLTLLRNERLRNISEKFANLLFITVICVIIITDLIYYKQVGPGSSQWLRYSIIFIPETILLVYLTVINRGWISKVLSSKFLKICGKYSSWMYLIHFPILRLLMSFSGSLLLGSRYTIASLALILTLGSSIAFDRFIGVIMRRV